MQFRTLELSDYDSFFDCLTQISPAPKVPFKDFANLYYLTLSNAKVVLVAIEDDKVVGTASILFEQKFSRKGCIAGHVEDVVVLPEFRKKGVATKLLEELVKLAKLRKCYKLTLHCDESVTPLYERSNFVRNGEAMRCDL